MPLQTPPVKSATVVLVAETGNDEIRRLFAVAGNLHVNFYENWDNAPNVAAGLADVRRFLDKLAPMA